VSLGLFKLTVELEFTPFQILPLDFQFLTPIPINEYYFEDYKFDHCTGLQWMFNTLNIIVEAKVEVLECGIGLRQYLTDEEYSCGYTSYDMSSLLEKTVFNYLEQHDNIIPWECNFVVQEDEEGEVSIS